MESKRSRKKVRELSVMVAEQIKQGDKINTTQWSGTQGYLNKDTVGLARDNTMELGRGWVR